MKELSGAIVFAALIIGAAIYLASRNQQPDRYASPPSARYEMVPASSGAWAYRINRQTGEVAFCEATNGCRIVHAGSPAR